MGSQPSSIEREQPRTLMIELVKFVVGVFQDLLELVQLAEFGIHSSKLSAYFHCCDTARGRLFKTTLGRIPGNSWLIVVQGNAGLRIHGKGADLMVFCLPAMLPRVQAMRLGRHGITEVARQPGQENAQRAGVTVQLPSFTERVPPGKKILDLMAVPADFAEELAWRCAGIDGCHVRDHKVEMFQCPRAKLAGLGTAGELHSFYGRLRKLIKGSVRRSHPYGGGSHQRQSLPAVRNITSRREWQQITTACWLISTSIQAPGRGRQCWRCSGLIIRAGLVFQQLSQMNMRDAQCLGQHRPQSWLRRALACLPSLHRRAFDVQQIPGEYGARTTLETEQPTTDLPPKQAQPEFSDNPELGSAKGMTTTNTNHTVGQTNHRLIRDALRAGPGAVEKVGSLRYRASAVLYLLLLEHAIDERGRCWSCPGALSWLLHHPDEVLRSHFARQFGREFGAVRLLSHRATGTPPRSGLTVKARPDPRDTRSHGPRPPEPAS